MPPWLEGPLGRIYNIYARNLWHLFYFSGLCVLVILVPKSSKLHLFAYLLNKIHAPQQNQRQFKQFLRSYLTRFNLYKLSLQLAYSSLFRYQFFYQCYKQFFKQYYSSKALPLITIVLATKRPWLLKTCHQYLVSQAYKNIEVIVVLHSEEITEQQAQEQMPDISRLQIIKCSTDWSLGECLNLAVAKSSAEYWVKMDDDDFYGQDYLVDLYHMLHYSQADMVGKSSYFMHLTKQQSLFLRPTHRSFSRTRFVTGGTFLIRKSVSDQIPFQKLATGTDTRFCKDVAKRGFYILSTDPFNYVLNRWESGHHHTWHCPNYLVKLSSYKIANQFDRSVVEMK